MRVFTITWRTTCAACWLLASSLPALAAPSPQASQEIGRLLSFVEDSGCTFIRNGSEYPAAEARAHLQKKLDYLERKDLVASSEDFIERAATRAASAASSYQVLRHADAQLRRLAEPGAAASAASPLINRDGRRPADDTASAHRTRRTAGTPKPTVRLPGAAPSSPATGWAGTPAPRSRD